MPGTTGILDAFTGAGPTSPPSASWGALGGYTNNLRLTGNQCDSAASTQVGGNHWNVATFGPDCEAYVTVDTLPTTDAESIARPHLRLVNPASATLQDGYRLTVNWRSGATVDQWYIQRLDDNAVTTIAGPIEQNVAAGEKILFEAIGDALKGYLYTGGSWVEIISFTDATYSAAGYLGLVTARQVVKLNDFGGGTVVAAAAPENTVAPAVTGNDWVDQTLTASAGTWTGTPTPTLTYNWQREDSVGAGTYTDISGATALTHVNVDADRVRKLRIREHASNASGEVDAYSAATTEIGTATGPLEHTWEWQMELVGSYYVEVVSDMMLLGVG